MRSSRLFLIALMLLVAASPALALGLSLSVEPSQPTAGDNVMLVISGFDSCPEFRPPELASGVASVFYLPTNCLAPPGPFTVSLPLGALPVGDYLVQILFRDGTQVSQSAFRVNPSTATPPCAPDAETLCLRGGRFRVVATLDTPGLGHFSGERALARLMSFESGMLYFFSSSNPELFVKMLDGCAVNGRHWLFVTGLTNLAATLRVTDSKTGEEQVIQSVDNGAPFGSVQDTAHFDSCPQPAGTSNLGGLPPRRDS